MYVEIYIDQFFAEQLLTGWLLLYLAAFAGKLRIKTWKFLAAGLAGSVCQCLYVIFGWKWISIAGYAGMAALAFEAGERGRGLVFLAVSSICFGGMLESVVTMIPVGIAAGSAVSSLMLHMIWRRYQKSRRRMEEEVSVLLEWAGTQLTVRALVDTGNRLTEPLTGKPVSILDGESASKLLGSGWEERKGFLLIPYHSIGREQGWMRGVAIDRVVIRTREESREVAGPFFAISNGKINRKNQYQVILNPEHLQEALGSPRG